MGNKTVGAVMMYLLAIAAFPPACFSSFIAANSFKTTLPNVNPFVSCGIGTIGRYRSGGLTSGRECGRCFYRDWSIVRSSLRHHGCRLSVGRKQWAGPRAGFNPAGWISWALGFAVGADNCVAGKSAAMLAFT